MPLPSPSGDPKREPPPNLASPKHRLYELFQCQAGRAGHLFQGRYRAILVDKDQYALELSRYIHLNPVRAHMVKDPLLYLWSSYMDYAGDRKRWDWVRDRMDTGSNQQKREEST